MISKAVEYALLTVAALVALWYFNDRIEAYYQKPLIDAHNLAIEKQAIANKKSIDALAKSKAVIKTVYVDRIKEIGTYAKTLPPDSACRANPEFVRLYNSISR